MSQLTKGFSLKAVDMPHGYADPGVIQVSVAKALPQTNTISLFTVAGTIVATLVGVVDTVQGAVATKLQLGVTGNVAALADKPTVAWNAQAAKSVVLLPRVLGAALPVPVTVSGAPASCVQFTVSNTIITATADASTTGSITWILHWVSLTKKSPATVTTN